jgi:hypothetical protein
MYLQRGGLEAKGGADEENYVPWGEELYKQSQHIVAAEKFCCCDSLHLLFHTT